MGVACSATNLVGRRGGGCWNHFVEVYWIALRYLGAPQNVSLSSNPQEL